MSCTLAQLSAAVDDPRGMQLAAPGSTELHYIPCAALVPFPVITHLLGSPFFREAAAGEVPSVPGPYPNPNPSTESVAPFRSLPTSWARRSSGRPPPARCLSSLTVTLTLTLHLTLTYLWAPFQSPPTCWARRSSGRLLRARCSLIPTLILDLTRVHLP